MTAISKMLGGVALLAILAALQHLFRYQTEYNVRENGVFTFTEALRRDRWRWEGSTTDLKYYEVCLSEPATCWRQLPDRSFWFIGQNSLDSPYIVIAANNRNGSLVEAELRVFDTRSGRELHCKSCDLNELIRSEKIARVHVAGHLASFRTGGECMGRSVVRLWILDWAGGPVEAMNLASIPESSNLVQFRMDPDQRAVAWIVCDYTGCVLEEYWIDTDTRSQQRVECGHGMKLTGLRMGAKGFFPVCE